jgi:hypothetical protein
MWPRSPASPGHETSVPHVKACSIALVCPRSTQARWLSPDGFWVEQLTAMRSEDRPA